MTKPDGIHPVFWKALRLPPPSDWEMKRVSDIASYSKGKIPDRISNEPSPDSRPYLLIDGLINGAKYFTEDASLPQITEDDVIVVADGSRSGLTIRGVSGALGSTLLSYRSKNGTDQNFLFYLLESLYPYTNAATVGGAVPPLDKGLLNNLRLSLPGATEQQAISSLLLEVDSYRQTLRRQFCAANRLKTSLLKQLFTKGIPGRHSNFVETRWMKAPEGWEAKRLFEFSEITSGFTMGRDLSRYETMMVPYVTVGNVMDGHLNLSDVGQCEIKSSELEALQLKRGDILMTEGGDRDKLGRGSVWKGEIEPCVYQNHIFRIRLEQASYLPRLFHFFLQTHQVKSYFYSHAKQTSNLCTVNSREVKRLPVFIPEREEQEQMLEILEAAESTISCIEAQQAALVRLKKSLLQNLLTGKIRLKPEALE